MRLDYISPSPREGISVTNRAFLEELHRRAPGPFTVAEAASWLDLGVDRARDLLGYLASRGWLSRVRRGLYVVVPLEASSPTQWREDPWIVAASVLAPCYVAGWSACEHWGLTDQVFRALVVVTARRMRHRNVTIQGSAFVIRRRAEELHFGTDRIWRRRTRVRVSDPSRTIVDVLDDPSIGGGILHISDVLDTYFASEHRKDSLLLGYADRLGNRTVFKRLGFLVEELGIAAPEIVGVCRTSMSAGVSNLDPSIHGSGGRIHQRWNLRVNATVGRR